MRYARQRVLPEVGDAGQASLARSRVLVVGAGGLGAPALLYLAAAGVGQRNAGGYLGVIDDDVVELSNLQRQILFAEADHNQLKATVATERLAQQNSHCDLRTLTTRLTAENVLSVMADYDIIVDGSDNFPTKYLINDAAARLGLPVVYGSILGFEGQASIFWAKTGYCYRCLYPEPPSSHVPNCAEAGTLGGIAGMIGSIQAVEACKLALGLPHCESVGLEPLIGKLLIADARNWEIQTLRIPHRADCPVCRSKPDEIALPSDTSLTCNTTTTDKISLSDLRGLMDSGIPFNLLDVREAHEWDAGHIDGAINIPLGQLLNDSDPLATLDPSVTLVVYCQHGIRSETAARHLRTKGYDTFNLLIDWSKL